MKAKIFSHNQLIGTTNLQVGDESMGHVFGDFLPTDFYFENLQKSVWSFWESQKANYEQWNSLRLNVQLENGLFLFPDGGFTIADCKNLKSEPKKIDIAGIHSKIINDYVSSTPPRPFVEVPWKQLYIEQKISFEDELKNELGLNEKPRLISLFNKPIKHELTDSVFSAFCHDQRNDDVLFEIKGSPFDVRFALVHLTWTGKKEKEGYPNTTFYTDYDDFKYSRMYPDKVEWEQ